MQTEQFKDEQEMDNDLMGAQRKNTADPTSKTAEAVSDGESLSKSKSLEIQPGRYKTLGGYTAQVLTRKKGRDGAIHLIGAIVGEDFTCSWTGEGRAVFGNGDCDLVVNNSRQSRAPETQK